MNYSDLLSFLPLNIFLLSENVIFLCIIRTERPGVCGNGCELEYVGGKALMVIGLKGVLAYSGSPFEEIEGTPTTCQTSGKAGIQPFFP